MTRKLKNYRLPPALIEAALRGERLDLGESRIPEDGRIINAKYDFDTGCILVTIHSEEFPEVPQYNHITPGDIFIYEKK